MTDFIRDAAIGREETLAMLARLRRMTESGELTSAIALRLYMADGSIQDVTVGGTAEEQAEALARLRATQA
jgi:hypothetical protein